MNDWHYIFVKVCDFSFKGPRELRLVLEEAKTKQGGELKFIEKEKVSDLERFLVNAIQKEISEFSEYFDKESNEHMKSFYQHYFHHLLWELKTTRFSHFSRIDELTSYLDYVSTSSGDCYCFPEPLLRLMAIAAYNLEIVAA